VTPLEVVVLIVSDDRAVVEADLSAGRLVCPRCRSGVLGGTGEADYATCQGTLGNAGLATSHRVILDFNSADLNRSSATG
jgi:hypothetical protein